VTRIIMQYPAMPATKTTRGHVISLFPDVILQGETVLYSYGKCPRYIVAIGDSAIAG
jgi:hypothetical protein